MSKKNKVILVALAVVATILACVGIAVSYLQSNGMPDFLGVAIQIASGLSGILLLRWLVFIWLTKDKS